MGKGPAASAESPSPGLKRLVNMQEASRTFLVQGAFRILLPQVNAENGLKKRPPHCRPSSRPKHTLPGLLGKSHGSACDCVMHASAS